MSGTGGGTLAPFSSVAARRARCGERMTALLWTSYCAGRRAMALDGESGLSVEPMHDVGPEQQSAQQRAFSSILSSDSIRVPSSRVLVVVSGATPSTGFWKVTIIAAISSAAITSSLHVRLGRSRS